MPKALFGISAHSVFRLNLTQTAMAIGLLRTLFYEKTRSPEVGRGRICVVLGAGADVSSGGMTFWELKKACLEHFSDRAFPSLVTEERVEDEFNAFFETLASEKQRAPVVDFLFHGMKSIRPSDSYKLLVLLAKAGIVDAIVTTNFDAILETAQDELGVDIFQIYAPGIASPYVAGKHLFVPPRPVYLKLHGDIKAKSITHITATENRGKPYDRSFSRLLQSILRTHTLIFIGYSGSDEPFARELAKAAGKIPRPIYWCNVSEFNTDSTFGKTLRRGEVVSVVGTFEEVLNGASPYPLRSLALIETKLHFLRPLLKDRIDGCNEQFVDSYAFKDDATRLTLLQSRKAAFDYIREFRFNSEKPLTVLTGLSGVGKTTLLCQLYDAEEPALLPELLLLRARGFTTTNFAEELAMRLGYAADNSFALLYEFSSWLRKTGQQLVVAIDGLNEFDWNGRKCLDLFKEILRVALWAQPHNSLKLLITMRPETWDEIFSTIDHGDLQKVLWNGSTFQDDLRALRLVKFSTEEMIAAYESYARYFRVTTPLRQLPEKSRSQLSDPYYLSLVMARGGTIEPDQAGFQLYREAFTIALEQSFGRGKARSLDSALLRLASYGLTERTTEFPLSLLTSVGIAHDELRILLEIPILQPNGTIYNFAHDRIHEYYLARAINELTVVQIRDWTELKQAIETARSYPKLASALIQCIVYSTGPRKEHYLRIILERFKGAQVRLDTETLVEERAIDFCQRVLTLLAKDCPAEFSELAESWLDRQSVGVDDEILDRILIRASRSLPIGLALPIFLRARREVKSAARGEVDVFIYDKVVDCILSDSTTADENCFNVAPLRPFFLETGLDKWKTALRLLGLILRVGPDNTHPDEWQQLSRSVSHQLDRLFEGYNFPRSAESELAELLQQNSNTLLFNASPDLIDRFFMAPSRQELGRVFEEIDEGRILTIDQLVGLRSYVSALDQNIEFVILNFFFVISMKADPAGTLQLFSDYYDSFSERTTPEELDFFLSALCLSHLALGKPCQEIIASYTERMIAELPQISFGYPGAARGERRALFSDPFDQQFDDGFNPLAFYCYNAAAANRQRLHYSDYIKVSHNGQGCVPLYWKLLERYEEQHSSVGVLRVIHALDEMINLWPIEGLQALEKLIGRTDLTIRRAIIRVLAEANARFPAETLLMLSRVGIGFTELEQFQIRWGTDPHMAHRALGQLCWARVMYFLDKRDVSGRFFNKVTQALVLSFSLPEALGLIMNEVVSGGSENPQL